VIQSETRGGLAFRCGIQEAEVLFMGGQPIQHLSRTNGEPSWIAYLGLQLLGPKDIEEAREKP